MNPDGNGISSYGQDPEEGQANGGVDESMQGFSNIRYSPGSEKPADSLRVHARIPQLDDFRISDYLSFGFHPLIPHKLLSNTVRLDEYRLAMHAVGLRYWNRDGLFELRELMRETNSSGIAAKSITLSHAMEFRVEFHEDSRELVATRAFDSLFMEYLEELPENGLEGRSSLDVVRHGDHLYLLVFDSPELRHKNIERSNRVQDFLTIALGGFIVVCLVYGAFMLIRLLWLFIAGLFN